MKPIRMYLDEAKARGLARNDSDIARQLGVTPQAVSKWKKGDDAPAEDTAARLSELLGKPEVMAECAAARAKTPEGRKAWERLARIAAAAVIVAAITPHNAHAMSISIAHTGPYCYQKLKRTISKRFSAIVNRFRRFISDMQKASLVARAQNS